MKKRMAVIMLGAVLAFAASAMADVTLEQIGTIGEEGEWIDGSSLVEMGGYGTKYAADLSGNALTEPIYYSFSYEEGYIKARVPSEDNVNTYGLLNLDGSSIVPCEYGDIRLPDTHWAVCFKLSQSDANQYDYETFFGDDAYFLIDTVDVYHLDGGSATLMASFPREEFLDYYAEGGYIKIQNRTDEKVTMYDGNFNVVAEGLSSVYDDADMVLGDYEFYYDNGQYGIKDRAGNVLVPSGFQYIYDVRDGLARVSTGDLEGLVDLAGNVVVPVQYENIRSNYYGTEDYEGYVAAGYVAVERDGKAAFCDLNGNETMEAKYAADNVEVKGASALMTDLEGNVHMLAADGNDAVLDADHTESLYVVPYSNGLLYTFRNADYQEGLLDWHGNEVLPAEYNSIELSGDGTMLLTEKNYEEYALYQVNYGDTSAAPAPEAGTGEGTPEDGTQAGSEEGTPEDDTQAGSVEGTDAVPVTEGTDVTGGSGSTEGTDSADNTEGTDGQTGSDLTPAGALLDSIMTLVDTDFENNRPSISSLLGSLSSLLTEDQAEAKSVIDSTVTLISSGIGDAASIKTLLESVRSMI